MNYEEFKENLANDVKEQMESKEPSQCHFLFYF